VYLWHTPAVARRRLIMTDSTMEEWTKIDAQNDEFFVEEVVER
jgi:hypothetical protein